MLCSPDTRRNARILHDEYPVILDALILHIFRKLDCMHDARIQPIKIFHLWCYSECASTPSKLKSLLGHGGNRTRDHRGQANFSACPVWMHTQSNITNIIFTWVHITPTTQKIFHYNWFATSLEDWILFQSSWPQRSHNYVRCTLGKTSLYISLFFPRQGNKLWIERLM
jgi:hypothetical protein